MVKICLKGQNFHIHLMTINYIIIVLELDPVPVALVLAFLSEQHVWSQITWKLPGEHVPVLYTSCPSEIKKKQPTKAKNRVGVSPSLQSKAWAISDDIDNPAL